LKKVIQANGLKKYFLLRKYISVFTFMYRIRDTTGEIVKGRFYENEMQSVKVDEKKIYQIERIVKNVSVRESQPRS